jgi:hypothetical protein
VGLTESNSEAGDLKDVKSSMNDMFPDIEPCITDEDDKPDQSTMPKEASGLGTPPDCIEAAKIVLNAIISDALTPNSPTGLGLPMSHTGGVS